MKTNLIAILLILGLVAALAMGQDGPPPVDPPVEPLPSDAQTEQAERDLRDDHYDAKRAAARDAGDDLTAQRWVAMGRGADLLVSMREAFDKYEREVVFWRVLTEAAERRIGELEAEVAALTPGVYSAATYDLPGLGHLPRVRIIYAAGIWAGGQDPGELPDREQFMALVRAKAAAITVLDIEQWETDLRRGDAAEVAGAIERLVTIIGWAKEAAPRSQIGLYGELPVRDYWVTRNDPGSEKYLAWQGANDFLGPLAAAVDVVFPSIYTFYADDEANWVKYAEANLAEARRYGKPVMPFVWPRYHDSNAALKGQGIPGGFWRLQLETLAGEDGTLIWDIPNAVESFTADSPWVAETRSFLEANQ